MNLKMARETTKRNKERKKKRLEKALVSCGDSSKKPNIHVRDWRPRRTGRGQKKVFEEIRTTFPKFMKTINGLQTQEEGNHGIS